MTSSVGGSQRQGSQEGVRPRRDYRPGGVEPKSSVLAMLKRMLELQMVPRTEPKTPKTT